MMCCSMSTEVGLYKTSHSIQLATTRKYQITIHIHSQIETLKKYKYIARNIIKIFTYTRKKCLPIIWRPLLSAHFFPMASSKRWPSENAYSFTFHVVVSNTNCQHITLHRFIQKIKWCWFRTMNMHVAYQTNCHPPRHSKLENWLHAADFSHKNKETVPWLKGSTVTLPLPEAHDLNAVSQFHFQ